MFRFYILGKPYGLNYNPMYKFENYSELIQRITDNIKVPKMSDIVVEAYKYDDLIDRGNTFEHIVNNLKMIYGG